MKFEVGDLVVLGDALFGVVTFSCRFYGVQHYDVMFFDETLGHIKSLPHYTIHPVDSISKSEK